MFSITQATTQVYSPFGSYVVEQHEAGYRKRCIDGLPRADLTYGNDHPLTQDSRNGDAQSAM